MKRFIIGVDLGGTTVKLGVFTKDGVLVESCTCNNKGCLKQYASATGIARLAQRRLLEDFKQSILRGKKYISAKTVFDAVIYGAAGLFRNYKS